MSMTDFPPKLNDIFDYKNVLNLGPYMGLGPVAVISNGYFFEIQKKFITQISLLYNWQISI